MSSTSQKELEIIKKCISKVARSKSVVAACIYGSRAAGYARPDSDIDILIVLENYPYLLKYVYLQEQGIQISALAIDRKALERDAKSAFLGEFVAGRLLHIYEPLVGSKYISDVEQVYKKRVILEEVQKIVDCANVLSTEILFPLEYIVFSKIKHRTLLYPSAAYSYFRTYTANEQNLEFALNGYRRALDDILKQDPNLFIKKDNNLLQISEERLMIGKEGKIRLKLTKKLQELNAYVVQTYAGRRIWHLAVKEAESKIKRHVKQHFKLPNFMSSPKATYWQLSEGQLLIGHKDWLRDILSRISVDFCNPTPHNNSYSVRKKRLGDIHSRTTLYIIQLQSLDREYKIVVKELAKSKAVKWAALSLWTAPIKRFRVDPLFRLGSEYKAIKYLQNLGLNTPTVEAVILDRKLLVTKFIEGRTLADMIKEYYYVYDNNDNNDNSLTILLRQAGGQIAKIHNDGASLGNIKPKNIIVSKEEHLIYFTDLEQLVFKNGDQTWDLTQFICWALKGLYKSRIAILIVREFLSGYIETANYPCRQNIDRLVKDRRYVSSFYPVLVPSVARVIKKELKSIANINNK
jgi:tRNA A-37 threonylcarbamoyl transferase component Bud32/predicted nucleotidyltransferase